MILIVSKEKLEPTTEEVMDWIASLGGSAVRLNGDNLYEPGSVAVHIDDRQVKMEFNRQAAMPLEQTDFRVGWFRRWSDRSYAEALAASDLPAALQSMSERILRSDENDLRDLLFSRLKVEHWLTERGKTSANKLQVLLAAREQGIEIPATLATGSRSDLLEFFRERKRIICKDLSYPFSYYQTTEFFKSMTVEIEEEDILDLPVHFYPGLFQQLIEKRYEIRIFYLDGQCYAMAIFSQLDAQTRVDFRNYNMEKPNRNVPYRLPEELEQKIDLLMRRLGLNNGSLDFIRALDGRYIFLEVNPVGQFGMTSYPCNYYLEKKVADYLVRRDKPATDAKKSTIAV